jgi:GPH family glycoside/pentoside/hexuronide:cation symporter
MKSRFAKIAYGTGNLGQGLFYNSVQTFLIFFYTDTVRLDPKLVGLAFAISYGVWNAINDPLIGVLSDRTRTRWGRRIPYIALGAPLTLLLYVLVFSPPLHGNPLTNPSNMSIFLYFAIIIAFFDLAYTAVSVTYTALFPESFRSLKERTEVSMYRQVAGMIGTVLGIAIMPVIVSAFTSRFGSLRGWTAAGIILGCVGGAAFGFSLLGSREDKRNLPQKTLPLAAAFKQTLVNRSFLAFAGANLMICFMWSWLSAMMPFFAKYSLGMPESQMSLLFAGVFITAILCYPLWRRLALKVGSKRALTMAVTLFVVFMAFVIVVKGLVQGIIMMLFVGAANSGITLIRDIVLSDVIDEDELHTGMRREGSYFGVTAFIERFALVLVGGGSSVVLGLSGYDAAQAAQPGSVSMGIRLGMGLLPVFALAIFLFAMRFYPLGKSQIQSLKENLETIQNAEAGQLTPTPDA